ncbi:hypothetical protein SDC9_176114 [bioreactor metagenome]|uniref:Uncharacterized protein n=1 Tax=bioreactor metagenome TaxID=1076179 RepID=A0A645GR14_9ZZZZ
MGDLHRHRGVDAVGDVVLPLAPERLQTRLEDVPVLRMGLLRAHPLQRVLTVRDQRRRKRHLDHPEPHAALLR